MSRQMLTHFDEANENCLGLRAMLEIFSDIISRQNKLNSLNLIASFRLSSGKENIFQEGRAERSSKTLNFYF